MAERGGGRPRDGYYLADGTRVPSVTTITGRFKDAGGLVRWAWNEGKEGRELYETRDKATEAGSICHDWIEDHLHGIIPAAVVSDQDADEATIHAALAGFEAFKSWAEMYRLEVIATELPLVSEEHRFGGTLDCLAIVKDVPVILDWKTSNAVYLEYVVQLAAYRELVRDQSLLPVPEPPRSALLLRVGKKYADFHFHAYPEVILDMGWRWFKHAREMYDLDKELKRVAA
jgi:hypothetical protein